MALGLCTCAEHQATHAIRLFSRLLSWKNSEEENSNARWPEDANAGCVNDGDVVVIGPAAKPY